MRATVDKTLLTSLRNHILHHALNNRLDENLAALSAEVPSHALLGVLGQDVDLDINTIAHLLLSQDDLLLRIRDEHDLPPALDVVDLGDGQAGAVEGDEALVHDVAQDVGALLLARLEPQRHGVAVGRDPDDLGRRVDVALHEVAPHARVGADGPLQVHAGSLGQSPQVREAQRLGRDAHFEAGLRRVWPRERRRRQTYAVDGDAVPEPGILQELRGRR